MLPKCSLTKYKCITAVDCTAIIVYFTVLKPVTLYLAWYSPFVDFRFCTIVVDFMTAKFLLKTLFCTHQPVKPLFSFKKLEDSKFKKPSVK